jgi:hypothetical protein
MTTNNTNARRHIEHVASREVGKGTRIQSLHAESSRNQVSLLNLVHNNSISRASPAGHHGGARACTLVRQSRIQIIEKALSLALLGE